VGGGGDAADFEIWNILIFSLSHIKKTDETERFLRFNVEQEGNKKKFGNCN
jgi:hypothetical protein